LPGAITAPVGKKNLPVPKAKGGKVYRYWIVLNFHTTRRYMKLVEISLSLDLMAILLK
jgi:hypothetical protein